MFTQNFFDRIKARLSIQPEEISEENPSPSPEFKHDPTQLKADIQQNNLLWDIPLNEVITSHRKFTGRFIVFGKKVAKKLLHWFVTKPLTQQKEFNGSVTRSINELSNIVSHQVLHYNSAINNLYKRDDDLAIKLSALSSLIEEMKKIYEENCLIQKELEGKVRELFQREQFPLDYRKFEDNFRGNEVEIKEQQLEAYYTYIKNKKSILDLGSGRGEFLEAFKEKGFEVYGVDSNSELVQYTQSKGLNIVEDDIINFLRVTKNKFDVITCLHVIEHLYPYQLTEVVRLSYDCLNSDGLVIFETPNPECIYNLAYGFTIDMTHKRMVHSYTMKYIMEQMGFKEVIIKHLAPVDSSISLSIIDEQPNVNDNFGKINRLLFGYQNYAVIGRK